MDILNIRLTPRSKSWVQTHLVLLYYAAAAGAGEVDDEGQQRHTHLRSVQAHTVHYSLGTLVGQLYTLYSVKAHTVYYSLGTVVSH